MPKLLRISDRSALAVAATLLGVVLGNGAATADVRASDDGRHGQLIFDWAMPTSFESLHRDDRLLLDFDHPVAAGFDAAMARVGAYVKEARIVGDGSQVLLVLADGVTAEESRDGDAVVVDLRLPGIDEAAGPAVAPTPTPQPMPPPQAAAPGPPAAERPSIRVRGGEHPTFSRLVFDWTETVGYDVARDDDTVRIVFDAPADADFARAAPAALSRVAGIAQLPGGRLQVAVTVSGAIRLRHFRTGTKIVLDVLDGEPAVAEAEAPAAESHTAAGSAGRPPTEPEPTASPARESDDRTGPNGDANDAETGTPAFAPVATEPARVAEPMPLLRSPPAKPVDPVASFEPGVPSMLAVFRRGASLWVLFAAEDRLDANALAAQGSPALGPVDVVRAEGGIALRFQPPVDGPVSVTRRGTAWTVAIEDEVPAREALSVIPQPDYPLGARVLIEGGSAQGLIRLVDPLVGDVLIVAPVAEPARGLAESVRFAQFRLLPTVQGVVATPLSQTVAMRIARDGVEITDVEGLRLSGSVDTARQVTFVAPPVEPHDLLFEIERWRGAESDFYRGRQAMERRLAAAPELERDRARLDLARFYFANGFAQETLGLLTLVEESQPSIVDRDGFAALRGAARVLADDMAGAVADLDHPELAGSPEVALWRALAAAKRGDWPEAAAGFERGSAMIGLYPSPFAEMFTRWSAEAAVRQGETATATDRLSRLSSLTEGESDDWGSTQFVRGLIARQEGDKERAVTAFEAAAGTEDRLYRTMADLALVELDIEADEIDWRDAVEKLETLRFAWRGDAFEHGLVDQVVDLYWRAGHYREALAALRQASRAFADTPEGTAYADRLQGRFVELFAGGEIATMPPMAAIALYNDFADLVPEGDGGTVVLEGLAERLVAMDLLDQAGDLLTDLVEERLTGAARVGVGPRLAAIRLLDGDPEAALVALDASEANGRQVEAELAAERRVLRASALSETGDASEALRVLEEDRTPLAASVRAEIAWRGQEWPAAAEALGQLVAPPPPRGETIRPDQAELVLNLGIALALAGDAVGLSHLARDYGPPMAASTQANTFAILTRSPGSSGPPIADLAAVRSQVTEVDLYQKFLASYRDGSAIR
ncbi:MAG: hypothetical protein HKM95_01480 [Inquilinus sp.]|nr:hypothetical protein [Inquilinus sp.]